MNLPAFLARGKLGPLVAIALVLFGFFIPKWLLGSTAPVDEVVLVDPQSISNLSNELQKEGGVVESLEAAAEVIQAVKDNPDLSDISPELIERLTEALSAGHKQLLEINRQQQELLRQQRILLQNQREAMHAYAKSGKQKAVGDTKEPSKATETKGDATDKINAFLLPQAAALYTMSLQRRQYGRSRQERMESATIPKWKPPQLNGTSVAPDVEVPHPIAGCRRLQITLRDRYNCTCTSNTKDPDCFCFRSGVQIYPLQDNVKFNKFTKSPLPPDLEFIWDMNPVYDEVVDHYCSSKPEIGCPLWGSIKDVRPFDIIYVDTGNMEDFVNMVIPNIKFPFHILSVGKAANLYLEGNSDQRKLVKARKLVTWFASNVNSTDPKIVPIPVGVHKKYQPLLNTTLSERGAGWEQDIYANFHVDDPQRCRFPPNFDWSRPTPEWSWQYKGHCFRRFLVRMLSEKKEITPVFYRVMPEKYFKDILRHRFILSPPGVGMDAFRTWESMYLGRVPVVSSLDSEEPMYPDLPVIRVQDWQKVSAKWLIKKEQELLRPKRYSYNSLTQVGQYVRMWRRCVLSGHEWKKDHTIKQRFLDEIDVDPVSYQPLPKKPKGAANAQAAEAAV